MVFNYDMLSRFVSSNCLVVSVSRLPTLIYRTLNLVLS